MKLTPLLLSLALLGCQDPQPAPGSAPQTAAAPAPSKSSGLAAFDVVYQVLKHPRCLNCHPAGDRPLQYDDSRPHAMNVQRGPHDRGRAGMRCSTCHQQANHDRPRLPPGSSVWRLAPRSMPFEGRSPRQLAAQLKDSRMSLPKLIHHVEDDVLVGWGWSPGPGRAPVPVPRAKFVAAVRTWIAAGTPLPEERAK